MERNSTSDPANPLQGRIHEILEILGLELSGLSQLTEISDSHLYAVANGTRKLTPAIATILGKHIKLKASKITDPSYAIPDSIRQARPIVRFYQMYSKSNPEYFKSTHSHQKNSFILTETVIKPGLLNEETSVYELRNHLKDAGKYMTSKEAHRTLQYMKDKNLVIESERPIIKKNGEQGTRMIKLYRINPDAPKG